MILFPTRLEVRRLTRGDEELRRLGMIVPGSQCCRETAANDRTNRRTYGTVLPERWTISALRSQMLTRVDMQSARIQSKDARTLVRE